MPAIGSRQSPIKINSSDAMQLAKPAELFQIAYENRDYHGKFIGVHPTHGNFELDTPPYPIVRFKSKTQPCGFDVYELRRIHIHLKSEHRIDSTDQSDYEVHFLHVKQGMTIDDPKLVVGILYQESATNQSGNGLEKFDELLRERAKTGLSLRQFKAVDPVHYGNINPLDFFPKAKDGKLPDLTNWFYYEGSLTSEPYSEDVSWFVMKNESQIDPTKLTNLEEYAEQEARPSYSLDRRLVVKSFE